MANFYRNMSCHNPKYHNNINRKISSVTLCHNDSLSVNKSSATPDACVNRSPDTGELSRYLSDLVHATFGELSGQLRPQYCKARQVVTGRGNKEQAP
jgi:hypothetical protein